ncbi:MAG: glycosyltransferase [Solirubrobacteraceae bacterium]|nr:glycosyltransferase [Solirubrobacteraceae bacterium]
MLRALAIGALAWLAVYLVWRIGWTLGDGSPVLSAVLLVAEASGWISLLFLTWFGWRLPAAGRPPAVGTPSVDVYVCTYDEPLRVLSATLAGCAALSHPHTTYVLDDGRRPEVATLAREWGAEYLTREDNAHAKAGNINAALGRSSGELVFVLDADHVPLPDALDALVGYFDDPGVVVVQSPHDFSNHDSIQHYEVGRHEQSIFFGVVSPGKDRHNAAFWCGSAAMLRRGALIAIGGVATETIAEDFHTTIRLHDNGGRTRYHDEVLVQGLAPHDLASYLLQRDRWARGNLAVFATPESPLRARGLTWRQRLSYMGSLFAYLAGPTRALLLAVLASILWTGALPFEATPLTIGLLWAPATVLAIAAGSALGRGYQTVADTTHFELLTAEIHLRALRCVVRPGRSRFRVTPKEGIDVGGWHALRQLRLLGALVLALGLGLVVRALDELGLIAFPGELSGMALWLIPALGVVELARLLRTLRSVGRRRQLRVEYRVPAYGAAILSVEGHATPRLVRLRDISPVGLGLTADAPLEPGDRATATLDVHGADGCARRIKLRLEVRSCRPDGATWRIGARADPVSGEDGRELIALCAIAHPWGRLRRQDSLPPEAPARPATADEATGRELVSA